MRFLNAERAPDARTSPGPTWSERRIADELHGWNVEIFRLDDAAFRLRAVHESGCVFDMTGSDPGVLRDHLSNFVSHVMGAGKPGLWKH